MLDLLVTGGLVVTPSGPERLCIGAKDGRIATLAGADIIDLAAKRTLDVDGMLVVPGGIDPHIHCNMEVVDPNGGPPSFTAGPDIVSRAALHGGTTTLLDFAWNTPGETIASSLDRQVRSWTGNCYSDFSFHVVLCGEINMDLLQEIPKVISAGFPTYKVFTTDVIPDDQPTKVPLGSILELMTITAEHGGVVAVHAEDDDLVMHMYRKLTREGRTNFANMSQVHSALSERLAFRRIIDLAESVPGTVLYMMHVSAASGVEAIAAGRQNGVAVFGETLHQYAFHNDGDYRESDGMKYHTYPSLKSEADNRALWQGVANGDISTFATDELCTTYAVKTAGRKINDVTGGNTGVEPRMAIVFTEAVQQRGLSLSRFVDITSANAAKIMGLHPRKGAIAIGSDADLAVLDIHDSRVITNSMLHESDYTPWEGWRVGAWPVATVLRGEVVVNRGEFTGSSQTGRLIPRRISTDVREGIL